MKYIALLRGINVGGNNKVPMAELRHCFEAAGFSGVSTYINSGNVIFEAAAQDNAQLVEICEAAIETRVGFRVVCAVISVSELRQALDAAPDWWGKGDAKHNALFAIAPVTAREIMETVGAAKPEYEKVAMYEPVIFWSAPLKTFSRTRYSTIVSTTVYASVTIRNANTARKLLELASA